MYKLELYDNKYTIIDNPETHTFKCLRNGEEWRCLNGDGMVLALVMHIQKLEKLLITKESE